MASSISISPLSSVRMRKISNRRRINVLSVLHHPTFGGPHNHNLCLIPRLAQQNIHTTVLLPSDPGNALERFRNAGIDTVTLPLHRLRASWRLSVHSGLIFNWPREIRAIRRLIRERSIDIVQINGLPHLHGAWAARSEGTAVVWQIIDGAASMPLRRLLMPIVRRFADVIMTTGLRIAEEHPGATQLGERLIPFFPPLDTDLFRPSQRIRLAARAELGVGPNDKVIGMTANLYPNKDHLNFIRAAAKVRTAIREARFIMLGASYSDFADYTDSLWREAARLNLKLGQDLIYRDAKSRVPELAQAFDLFWLTSKPNSEGAPTCIEEALALELPVVATDVGSVSEMIQDGVNGYVVPPQNPDAIATTTIKLFADSAALISMGKRGREIAEARYNLDICADVHARAFAAAIAYSRSRRVSNRR